MHRFATLQIPINMLLQEHLWLPLSVLRVKVGLDFLNYYELQALVGGETKRGTEERRNNCERKAHAYESGEKDRKHHAKHEHYWRPKQKGP